MKAFRVWFNELSITLKYIIVIFLIAVPIIFGALFTQSKNDDMDYYGTSYNVLQSERMRIFLLANYSHVLFIANEDNDIMVLNNAEAILKDQIEVFSLHIEALRYGDESLNITPPTDPAIIQELDELLITTNAFLTNIETLMENPDNETALQYISTHTLSIDKDFYDLAVMIETTYIEGYQQLSMMNFLIIVVVVVMILFALMQFRLLKRIEFQAKYDLLTNLLSRSSLYNQIQDLNAEDYTIMFIDIHHFKLINDVYGQEIGDVFLQEISKRLRTLINTKRIYRYGGDEFVVLIEGVEKSNEVLQHMDNFKTKLLAPVVDKKGRNHHFNITLGAACVNIGITSFEDKIQFAEDLRYDSRNYRLEPMICKTKEESDKRRNLEKSIIEAIDNDQIEAYFHPLHYADGALKGFESLARWNLNGETISPSVFIPLINKQGLGYELDLKMIELVGKAYPTLKEASKEYTPIISINLAVDTIMNISATKIISALHSTNIEPKYVVLEILEDVIINNQTRSKLSKLKEAGYTIALDDFTTGATSFDYLTLSEFDIVKIDQGVVKQLRANQMSKEVIKDLIQMIHTTKKDVVIEGVEECHEKEKVIELGVDIIQGYCYSKPLPLQNAIAYIQDLDKQKP